MTDGLSDNLFIRTAVYGLHPALATTGRGLLISRVFRLILRSRCTPAYSDDGRMDSVHARLAFWTLVVELGVGSFLVRRVLERTQAGELTLLEAERALRACVEARIETPVSLR